MATGESDFITFVSSVNTGVAAGASGQAVAMLPTPAPAPDAAPATGSAARALPPSVGAAAASAAAATQPDSELDGSSAAGAPASAAVMPAGVNVPAPRHMERAPSFPISLPPKPTFARSLSIGNRPGALVRQASRVTQATQQQQPDWRTFLTIEDRQGVRDRVKRAYQEACPSYEELLATVVAIDEELMHVAAPSRLDYFKWGLDFGMRVRLKQRQLRGLPSTPASLAQDRTETGAAAAAFAPDAAVAAPAAASAATGTATEAAATADAANAVATPTPTLPQPLPVHAAKAVVRGAEDVVTPAAGDAAGDGSANGGKRQRTTQ